eukprot:8218999-Heterocapsa_arctica.AAC.1
MTSSSFSSSFANGYANRNTLHQHRALHHRLHVRLLGIVALLADPDVDDRLVHHEVGTLLSVSSWAVLVLHHLQRQTAPATAQFRSLASRVVQRILVDTLQLHHHEPRHERHVVA